MMGRSPKPEELDLRKFNNESTLYPIIRLRESFIEGTTIILPNFKITNFGIFTMTKFSVSSSYIEYNARDMLLEYTGFNVLDEIEKHIDLDELFELIVYIEGRYGLKPRVSYSIVPETGEFDAVEIILDDCTWDEWVKIASETKKWLREKGRHDLAGKVAITCIKGLQEPKP